MRQEVFHQVALIHFGREMLPASLASESWLILSPLFPCRYRF
jgi:hypothetical protein